MTAYKIHPLAEAFPPFTEQEFNDLVRDIGQYGQRNVITLFEGKILDGVHRYKACLKLHMEPKVRSYIGKDPLAFAVSANLKRRHLSESQRAMIAAELSGSKNGRPAKNRTPGATVSNKQAAEALDVSEHSVDRAKSVLKHGEKSDIEAVRTGKTTVREAAKKIKERKEKNLDKTDYPIPDEILDDWREAEAFGESLKSLHRILLRLETGLEKGELILREISNSVTIELRNVWSELDRILPYAVCPTCSGKNRKSCTLCKQRGFLSRFGYEHFVPKKTREIRENASAVSK